MPIHASAAFLLLAIPAALTGADGSSARTASSSYQHAIDFWKDHPDLLGRH